MPKVGLYFYVNRKILMDAVDLKDSELYGDFMIGRSSHDEIWNREYLKVYKKPYDYYPRGRIVFKIKEDRYILYADKCIGPKELEDIKKAFELDGEKVTVASDLHYVCKKCNTEYYE